MTTVAVLINKKLTESVSLANNLESVFLACKPIYGEMSKIQEGDA